MSIALGACTIECSNCEQQHTFSHQDCDFECTGGEERQMGPENIYEWEFDYKCEECGNTINGNYSVAEYPEGVVNHQNIEIDGGNVIGRFSFDFSDRPEPDDI